VREIQLRSGLLIERRPDVFAFSHLTFQEYFTALDMVHKGDHLKLLKFYKDPWWHEVIALAAGLPGADAAGFIRALLQLDYKKKTVSTATLLAAQCIETAIDLPVSLRREVEGKLKNLVPPQSNKDVDRLVALGEVAGPILLRALGNAEVAGRAYTAVALGRIGYEPATNALIRLLSDMSAPDSDDSVFINYPVGGIEFRSVLSAQWAVAYFASLMLFHMATASSSIRPLVEQALRRVPRAVLSPLVSIHAKAGYLRREMGEAVWQQLDILISSTRGKPAPRRVARFG
jgi:hypothetical protein